MRILRATAVSLGLAGVAFVLAAGPAWAERDYYHDHGDRDHWRHHERPAYVAPGYTYARPYYPPPTVYYQPPPAYYPPPGITFSFGG